jgi:hypothetical protein
MQDEPPSNDLDWLQEIQDIVKLEGICTRSDIDKVSLSPFSSWRDRYISS